MVKLIALQKAYALGRIIEAGETFSFPDEDWADEKRRPSWAKPALFGGRGDHDGNGTVGGAAPPLPVPQPTAGPVVERVELPENWQALPAKDRKALAKQITGKSAANAADADAAIAAYEAKALADRKPETEPETEPVQPFGDAPPPGVVSNLGNNGLQQAFGGGVPDWVAPDGTPTLGAPTVAKLADD